MLVNAPNVLVVTEAVWSAKVIAILQMDVDSVVAVL